MPLSSPCSEAAARFVHRVDLGVSERPAAACARADPADRRRAVDRQSEGGPDAALRSGVATPVCRDIGLRVVRCAIPLSGHRYVGTGVRGWRAFKPGGTVPFMRMPAHETSDADVPLEALWGRRRTAALRERLLESDTIDAKLDVLEAALQEMWRPPGLHPAVTFALAAFDRAPLTTSIGAVTDAIGLSAKRFIERFTIEVGLTPKRYCRIRRFQRAVTMANRGRRVDGRGWRSTAATSIRRTSFTTSGRSRA